MSALGSVYGVNPVLLGALLVACFGAAWSAFDAWRDRKGVR